MKTISVEKYTHQPISAKRRKLRNQCKADLLIFGLVIAAVVVALVIGGC